RDAESSRNCHRLGECELALCHRLGDICFFLKHHRHDTILQTRFLRCGVSALLFAAAFVFWNYYPHELPLPTLMTAQQLRAKPAKSPTYVVIAIQKITDPEAY